MYRIAVDIVTGFLGSGKTTLLRRLASSTFGRNVALLVNELGEVDVDGRVLGLGSVEKAVELPGGCLCCQIDELRFEAAVAELVAVRAPDLIVIETSGVAEPHALLARVRAAGLTLDAVTAVVDAEVGRSTLREHAVARAQVAAADFVVINKCDLAPPGAIDALCGTVATSNARALVYRAERCQIELSLLFATGVRRHRDDVGAPAAQVAHQDVTARVFRTRGLWSRAALEAALARLPRSVHRAKGIVRVTDGAWALLFNYVCGRTELEWLPLPGDESQCVVIGRDLDRAWPEIEAMLRATIVTPSSDPHDDPTPRC